MPVPHLPQWRQCTGMSSVERSVHTLLPLSCMFLNVCLFTHLLPFLEMSLLGFKVLLALCALLLYISYFHGSLAMCSFAQSSSSTDKSLESQSYRPCFLLLPLTACTAQTELTITLSLFFQNHPLVCPV